MMSKSLLLGVGCAVTLATLCSFAEDKKTDYDTSKLPPAAAKQGVTYATDIQPIFATSCYPCHGPKSQKPKGKLRVDTLDAVMKGGEDGACVVPNDIAKSTLLADVAHLSDPDDYMPPPKNRGHLAPLTKDQVALVRAWIEQGAK